MDHRRQNSEPYLTWQTGVVHSRAGPWLHLNKCALTREQDNYNNSAPLQSPLCVAILFPTTFYKVRTSLILFYRQAEKRTASDTSRIPIQMLCPRARALKHQANLSLVGKVVLGDKGGEMNWIQIVALYRLKYEPELHLFCKFFHIKLVKADCMMVWKIRLCS